MAIRLDSSYVKQQALALGFHRVGIATIDSPEQERQRTDSLRNWLAQGYQADMAWMNNPKRQQIRQVMPEVRSVICVALNYYVPQTRPNDSEASQRNNDGNASSGRIHHYGKIARYAWGRDYHRVLQKKLKALTHWLQMQVPAAQVRYYADTGPIQDKVWAERAGIGWIAKNGNLITRDYGSWVFLGEVLTNLELDPDPPHTSHCGTCTRCIMACPTGAIVHPSVVDANRCIAYHTIENRAETLPAEIADNLHGWVAGCDICQDVCPWNQRFAQPTDIEEFQPYPLNVAPLLEELAEITDEEYDRRFPASALRRIKPHMLRRNAQAALQQKRVDN